VMCTGACHPVFGHVGNFRLRGKTSFMLINSGIGK
jgi:hypothetical protein